MTEPPQIPARKTGLPRLTAAAGYTMQGLRHALRHEPAFRQEAVITAISLAVLVCLPVPTVYKLAVVLANLGVLVTELLNSALEALTDKTSPGFDPLAKQAKDMGSAAVFLALSAWAVAWLFCLAVLAWPGMH